jgi:hypothetical protein
MRVKQGEAPKVNYSPFQRPRGRYFHDTNSNLGHLFPYKLIKQLAGHLPKVKAKKKTMRFQYRIGIFETISIVNVKFPL